MRLKALRYTSFCNQCGETVPIKELEAGWFHRDCSPTERHTLLAAGVAAADAEPERQCGHLLVPQAAGRDTRESPSHGPL